MKLFINGRKFVWKHLNKTFTIQDKIIWIHAASLGEYEQAVPVIEALKRDFPTYKILISFFSPSGYEIKKNNLLADCTIYLPLDTKKNAKRFVASLNIQLAIFVKYEVWPNYLKELHSRGIPKMIISGVFRENQIYFKPYGKFLQQALFSFDYIFTQEESSKNLLLANGYKNAILGGDTRYDRVYKQRTHNNNVPFIDEFIDGKICIVCGSTWPEDEKAIIDYINQTKHDVKLIIAPHVVKENHINMIYKQLQVPTQKYSQLTTSSNVKNTQVLLIDSIGLLSKLYSYAAFAYVGGAMGNTGLHNILEPATFGIPIIIGVNHKKFPEAIAMKQAGGLIEVANDYELKLAFNNFLTTPQTCFNMGNNAIQFVMSQLNATQKIIHLIDEKKLISV
ncbi:3-deoxy-D-manno-octulosonic-acid transferase [Mesonia hippocampi]|uniref:3-deoxy-D-manno-octulosonic acid transferase n=1 Tax=Mesonia hippocampi TaxID=1628250 RepID=A0A840EK11_9FLAO|nr:glycosyltransferase N-terminal domain-containing protein [Mesonia hippocampi]MBB4118719.1 3-deoxy-D-manno-octulosonic-acid transferase [Mesonia hippocampi]